MTGAELIASERLRQINIEGWSDTHDDGHDCGELALAAACYATPILIYKRGEYANQVCFADPWPWDEAWDKRPADGNVLMDNKILCVSDRIRQLAKAGALIAAEIDRLLRFQKNTNPRTP